MTPNDQFSQIAIPPRGIAVEDDNGALSGSIQISQTTRSTESTALKNLLDPDEFKAIVERHLKLGEVWCDGDCQCFRHWTKFTKDVKARGRLYRHMYCKKCRAHMAYGKNKANGHPVNPVYQYQARRGA